MTFPPVLARCASSSAWLLATRMTRPSLKCTTVCTVLLAVGGPSCAYGSTSAGGSAAAAAAAAAAAGFAAGFACEHHARV